MVSSANSIAPPKYYGGAIFTFCATKNKQLLRISLGAGGHCQGRTPCIFFIQNQEYLKIAVDFLEES